MSFSAKQWILTLLEIGGISSIAFGLGFYDAEEVSWIFCIAMCFFGAIMLAAGGIFMHFKMRCSHCRRLYPIYGWWGMECCPYCGEYFDK